MNRLQCRSTALAVALFLGTCGVHAAQRVFVASTGNDANTATGCLITAPCRSFAAALSQVDPEGEVVALDAAGYGAVTITKSVTITANPGFYAGIAAATGNAVTIATPGVRVVLRGLVINGVGGQFGVAMLAGTELTVENCVVSNFGLHGIGVTGEVLVRIVDTVARGNGRSSPADGIWLGDGVKGSLSRVRMSGNSRAGLLVQDGSVGASVVTMSDSHVSGNAFGAVALSEFAAGQARLAITRSTVANNQNFGVASLNGGAGAGAAVAITSSTVSGNATGLLNTAALLESHGNNLVRGNSLETSGPIIVLGGV